MAQLTPSQAAAVRACRAFLAGQAARYVPQGRRGVLLAEAEPVPGGRVRLRARWQDESARAGSLHDLLSLPESAGASVLVVRDGAAVLLAETIPPAGRSAGSDDFDAAPPPDGPPWGASGSAAGGLTITTPIRWNTLT
jgi:hypothetical protein